MNNKRWTEEEVFFLKQNHKTMIYKKIGEDIGRSLKSVCQMAFRLNLNSERKGITGAYARQDKEHNGNWKGGISKDYYKYTKRTKAKHPKKNKAGEIFRYAIRVGKIIRPTNCSSCNKYSKRIEGHHEDYDKPLEVEWLCRKCHIAEHKKLKASLAC
ncbi:hypothetical protein LCGC14_0441680 [marine sediment metagenome]|uniref:Uncharacterized protein n=1 Tax=marine sediment metagenome TaxID=412755 RepID=A0A0F9SK15_9ZZZZ